MVNKDPTLQSLRAYRRVGATVPKPIVDYFEKKLRVAGVRQDVRLWLGTRFLLSFFIGALLLVLYLIIYNPIATAESEATALFLFLAGFLLVMALAYLQLYFRISDRTTTVEKILPDFLLLTVSNLRAGMSPFPAFVRAARPEFGAFYEEIKMATAKSGGKTSLESALSEVASNFDSQVLRRTVNLFAKGIRSGGQLAKLLNSSADEVRRIQDLRAELASSTRTYSIFLGFILVIIMPFLLSVSTHFVSVFLKINAENQIGGAASASNPAANLPVFSGVILVTTDDMVRLSILTLALTSLFVSGLIGIISKGKAIYGLKYFPILAITSSVFFFLAKSLIEGLLAGFGT